jgi:hypothetical protein
MSLAPGTKLAPTKSPRRSARAGWVKCIAPATKRSNMTAYTVATVVEVPARLRVSGRERNQVRQLCSDAVE